LSSDENLGLIVVAGCPNVVGATTAVEELVGSPSEFTGAGVADAGIATETMRTVAETKVARALGRLRNIVMSIPPV
jgi:hypothetical protein